MCKTDEECISQCLSGHPEAFRRLIQRHQKAVLTYLVARTGSEDLAEEVAQEAFVRAYLSLGKLRKTGSFLPWLLGIAVRAGQELARSRRRLPAAGDLLEVPARPETKDCPEDDALGQAVARLPAVYREAIHLRYHAGLSCAEMSENLGIPIGSVTKRLSRAYAILREAMVKHECACEDNEVKS